MSKNSKQLQTFIKSHFQKLLPKNRFSPVSTVFLENLFLRMEEGFSQFDTAEIKEETLNMKTTFPTGPDYSYISEEIRSKIENFPKIGKKFEFVLTHSSGLERIIRVYFILPMGPILTPGKQSLFLESCLKYIKKIYTWYYIANSFSSTACSRDLDIYLYFTNHLKSLPKENSMIDGELMDISIGQLHSNSAFTFSCNRIEHSKENDIYIYRFEEWFKVLIHESFHSLGLDFSGIPQIDIDSKILELFDVKSDPRFYETYTETWAEIINAMFFVYLSKKPRQRRTLKKRDSKTLTQSLVTNLASVLELEQMFSIFQSTKVLQHFGLTYRELVSTDSVSSEKRHRLYKEKTQVLAYYIMKSVFLWNVENFVEFCAIKNRGSLQWANKRNIFDLIGLLKTLYQDPKYMKTIEYMEKEFDKKTKGSHPFIGTTLRMTLLEYF